MMLWSFYNEYKKIIEEQKALNEKLSKLIDDEEIIDAILYHTTGRPGMSLLEKIVYIADYIEPGRNHAPNLGEIRELCFADLDEALLKILEDILVHLKESKKEIDPMTQMTYEFYKRKQSEE